MTTFKVFYKYSSTLSIIFCNTFRYSHTKCSYTHNALLYKLNSTDYGVEQIGGVLFYTIICKDTYLQKFSSLFQLAVEVQLFFYNLYHNLWRQSYTNFYLQQYILSILSNKLTSILVHSITDSNKDTNFPNIQNSTHINLVSSILIQLSPKTQLQPHT